MAFTDYETEQLRKALLKETRHCAVTLGMKKTSVEQLTKAVGIAKGSFYKFYESKEMLFFAVLENIHSELYGVHRFERPIRQRLFPFSHQNRRRNDEDADCKDQLLKEAF